MEAMVMDDLLQRFTPAISRVLRNLLTPAFALFGFDPLSKEAGDLTAICTLIVVFLIQLTLSKLSDKRREIDAKAQGALLYADLGKKLDAAVARAPVGDLSPGPKFPRLDREDHPPVPPTS